MKNLGRMLSKMTYHFPEKILGSRISLTYKENLTTNLGKILRSFENRAPETYIIHYLENTPLVS